MKTRPMDIEYKTIYAHDVQLLDKKLNDLAQIGFKPLFGPAYVPEARGYVQQLCRVQQLKGDANH